MTKPGLYAILNSHTSEYIRLLLGVPLGLRGKHAFPTLMNLNWLIPAEGSSLGQRPSISADQKAGSLK